MDRCSICTPSISREVVATSAYNRRSSLWLLSIGALFVAGLLCGCGGSSPTEPANQAANPSSAGSSAAGAESTEARNAATTTNPEKLLATAEAELKQGRANEALALLNQAIEVAPELALAYQRRAELLAAANHHAEAIADLDRVLEMQPKDARVLNTRGYLRMARNDLTGAMEDFSAAIGIDLDFPQPYNNRGLVRITEGQPEKALHEFDAALRIDANYIDAHNNRGYTLMQLDRHDEAVDALSKALELDPGYVNAWNNRGLAHKEAGRYEEAAADFSKAIELQPTQTKYYLHRSEALTALDRNDEARADIDRVVWLDKLVLVNRRVATSPEEAEAWLERSEHMRRGQRFEAALKDVARALQLYGSRPEASDAYVLQGRILLEQGHAEQAIEAVNAGLRVRPQEQAYSVRGDAQFQLQNYEAALDDYRQARRLDPMVQQALELRAAQLEKAGDIQQAGYFREQAEALAPDRLIRTASTEEPAPLPFPDQAAPSAGDAAASP